MATSRSKPRKRKVVVKVKRSSWETRHAAWVEAMARLVAAINRLRDAPAPMGNEWRDKQVAYFERRLEELRAAEPKPQV